MVTFVDSYLEIHYFVLSNFRPYYYHGWAQEDLKQKKSTFYLNTELWAKIKNHQIRCNNFIIVQNKIIVMKMSVISKNIDFWPKVCFGCLTRDYFIFGSWSSNVGTPCILIKCYLNCYVNTTHSPNDSIIYYRLIAIHIVAVTNHFETKRIATIGETNKAKRISAPQTKTDRSPHPHQHHRTFWWYGTLRGENFRAPRIPDQIRQQEKDQN